jgi:hypothetical protein
MPIIVWLYAPAFGRIAYIGGIIVLYVISKILEFGDREIFALGEMISGHSLKHLVAAMAPLVFLSELRRRRFNDESGS